MSRREPVLMRDITENPLRYFSLLLFVVVDLAIWFSPAHKDVIAIYSDLGIMVYILLLFSMYLSAIKDDECELNEGKVPGSDNTAPVPRDRLFKLFEKFRKKPILIAGIAVIFLLALFLRLSRYNFLGPTGDELAHLMTVKRIVLDRVNLNTDALPMAYFLSLFFRAETLTSIETAVTIGRIPFVLIGAATVVPIYWLARRISLPVGMLCAFLWACSPWAIGVARTVNEYGFCAFFLLIVLCLLMSTLEAIRTFSKGKVYIVGIGIAIIAYVGWHWIFFETHTIANVFELVFGLTLVWYFFDSFPAVVSLYNKNRWKAVVLVAVQIIVLALIVYRLADVVGMTKRYTIVTRYLSILTDPASDSGVMWWSGLSPFGHVAYFLVFLGAMFAGIEKRRNYFFLLAIFVATFLLNYLYFRNFFRTRYAFMVLPFYTILVGTGAYYLLSYVNRFKGVAAKTVAIALVGFFLFHAFNYQNTVGSYLSLVELDEDATDYDYSRYTGEFHRRIDYDLSYLKDKVSDEDIVITTIPKDNFLLEIEMNEYRYYYFVDDSDETNDWIDSLIREHKQGWIVLDDAERSDFTDLANLPEQEREFAGKKITLLIDSESEKIFSWGRD